MILNIVSLVPNKFISVIKIFNSEKNISTEMFIPLEHTFTQL